MAFEGAKIKLKPGGFSAKLNYTDLEPEEQQRRERAIADVRSWMETDERFDLLVGTIQEQHVKNNRVTYRKPSNLRMIMGFMCAFEGYPATAMLKRYHPRYIRMFGIDGRGRNVVPMKR